MPSDDSSGYKPTAEEARGIGFYDGAQGLASSLSFFESHSLAEEYRAGYAEGAGALSRAATNSAEKPRNA